METFKSVLIHELSQSISRVLDETSSATSRVIVSRNVQAFFIVADQFEHNMTLIN